MQLRKQKNAFFVVVDNGIKPGTIEIRNRQIFQEQADESGVIILVLSQQFVQSRTCQQQVNIFI